MTRIISNYDMLGSTPLRRDALLIMEAGYAAIDTDAVVRRALVLEGSKLTVGEHSYDLAKFKRVKVIGFGKASCKAMRAIESVLRSRITEGIAIDVSEGLCDVIQIKQGTHPRPTPANVAFSGEIMKMARSTEEDLVIVAVSGGGSSLLCWPLEECEQGARLYDDFTRVGATIDEMNTVRKHISQVKGGGLAAALRPATVIGLIFCDIPGDRFEDVASGPTYFDRTTVADAQRVLDTYSLTGYTLNETPKDESAFERVVNVPVVSNTVALAAMAQKAKDLGLAVASAGDALYDAPKDLVRRMREKAAVTHSRAIVAAGEPKLVVSHGGGKGGRCQYVALEALKQLSEGEVLLAAASDGIDNSDSAGAIADSATRKKAEELGVSIEEHLGNFNTYEFFEKTGDIIFTGRTDSNVSDLFVYVKEE